MAMTKAKQKAISAFNSLQLRIDGYEKDIKGSNTLSHMEKAKLEYIVTGILIAQASLVNAFDLNYQKLLNGYKELIANDRKNSAG
jgi:hypothetical protein